MKHFIAISIALLLFSWNINAQEQKNAISTNALGILLSINSGGTYALLDVGYERSIKEKISLYGSIFYGKYYVANTYNGNGVLTEESEVKAYGLIIEGRFYPISKNKTAPRGLFIGAYYEHMFLNDYYRSTPITNDAYTIDRNYYAGGLGLDLGLKMGKGALTWEPLVGYAYNWNNRPTYDDTEKYFGPWDIPLYFLRTEIRLAIVF